MSVYQVFLCTPFENSNTKKRTRPRLGAMGGRDLVIEVIVVTSSYRANLLFPATVVSRKHVYSCAIGTSRFARDVRDQLALDPLPVARVHGATPDPRFRFDGTLTNDRFIRPQRHSVSLPFHCFLYHHFTKSAKFAVFSTASLVPKF